MKNEPIRILAADDDPEILKILSRILAGEGYQVVTAADGREAIERAAEDIDLYILDVNMPAVSGFAAAVRIRERFFAPIIFLTAYSGEGDRQMGFLAETILLERFLVGLVMENQMFHLIYHKILTGFFVIQMLIAVIMLSVDL